MSVFMRVGSDGFSCLFKERQPELWIKRHCAASYTNAHIAADSLMVCTCVLMRVEVRTLIFARVQNRQRVIGPIRPNLESRLSRSALAM